MKISERILICIGIAAIMLAAFFFLIHMQLKSLLNSLQESNNKAAELQMLVSAEKANYAATELVADCINDYLNLLKKYSVRLLYEKDQNKVLKDAFHDFPGASAVFLRSLENKANTNLIIWREDTQTGSLTVKPLDSFPAVSAVDAFMSSAQSTVYSSLLPVKIQNQEYIALLFSVKNQDESSILGLVGIVFPADKFLRTQLKSVFESESQTMSLISKTGKIVPIFSSIQKKAPPVADDLRQRIMRGIYNSSKSSASIPVTSEANPLFIYSMSMLQSNVITIDDTWFLETRLIPSLSAQQKDSEQLEEIKFRKLFVSGALSIFACFALFFTMILFLSRAVTEPLKQLVKFANELAKGEFPTLPANTQKTAEIAELVRSLNFMKDRLQASMAKLKKSHEREKSARKEAETANNIKSGFLTNMSLELRNPLNSIMGFSSLIIRDVEKGLYDQALNKKAHAIYESAQTLNQLISNLLELSRLDTGISEINVTEIDTAATLNAIVQSSAQVAGEKNVAIENHYSANTPPYVRTDKDILTRILNELMASAIRNSQDSGTVSIGCDGTSDKIIFWVQDGRHSSEGKSLAETFNQYRDIPDGSQIFNTFMTASLLGLTIARNSAIVLGADIEADTTEDGSSVFKLVFPRNEIEVLNSTDTSSMTHTATNWSRKSISSKTHTLAPVNAAPKTQSIQKSRLKAKILMAEDNEANRMLVEMMLQNVNCTLDCVPDGYACLDALEKNSYDILLLDLQMPNLDGYSVLRKIRADKKYDSMPVIVLTAYLEEGDKEKLIAQGANSCILKPVNLDEILNALRKYSSV